MKYQVGDIIRSKHNMTVENLDEKDEYVNEGQYFVVISYSERGLDNKGFTILSQKSGSHSFWNEESACLSESFNRE